MDQISVGTMLGPPVRPQKDSLMHLGIARVALCRVVARGASHLVAVQYVHAVHRYSEVFCIF